MFDQCKSEFLQFLIISAVSENSIQESNSLGATTFTVYGGSMSWREIDTSHGELIIVARFILRW